MDDKTLALLGDKPAQFRLTERGELLPCPFCNGTQIKIHDWTGMIFIECQECRWIGCYSLTRGMSMLEWNSRAPILTPEQIKRLQNDEDRKKINGIEYKRLGYCMALKKACSKCRIHKEMKVGETCSEFAERNPELAEQLIELGAIRD